MAGITEIIAEHMARCPFVWGESDCCLAVCDALAALGLPDPATPWRGRYSDAAGAAAMVDAAGGMEALAGAACAALGWPETDAPRPGDVGVLNAPTPLLAIYDGSAWCAKTERGLLRISRPAARAWATGWA